MSKTRMVIKHTQSLALAIVVLGMTRAAAAADYYVATDGADGATGTASAPWATFAHAFSAMSGGDKLIVKDGTYHQSVRGVPSGSSSNYTTVKAEHDFKVVIAGSGTESLSPNGNYIQIEGMKFDGEGVRNSAVIAGNHHVKLLRCAFYGAPCSDNTTVISAGPNSHDMLFEDCWAFGCGRYKFTVYQSQRVIFRRCVSRHDYHKYADDQCATFTTYDSEDTLYQNVIALDSGQDPAEFGSDVGGIWSENNDRVTNNVVVQGSIFLNLDTGVLNDPKVYGTQKIQDVVAWDTLEGAYVLNIYNDWQGAHQPSISVTHATMGKIRGVHQDAAPAGGIGFTGEPGYTNFPFQVRDSLLYQCNSYGVGTDVDSDYNDFFANATDYMPQGKGAGAHDAHVDPKLKYIVRVEKGSALEGKASDGLDVGANVEVQYGVSGTLWGEPGYDQRTTIPLWPYPYEAEVKADMAAWAGPHDGKRGFCAPGNGLYGGPITLTSYIWEYLGNPCPEDKCNGATTTTGTGGTTAVGAGGAGTGPTTGGNAAGGIAGRASAGGTSAGGTSGRSTSAGTSSGGTGGRSTAGGSTSGATAGRSTAGGLAAGGLAAGGLAAGGLAAGGSNAGGTTTGVTGGESTSEGAIAGGNGGIGAGTSTTTNSSGGGAEQVTNAGAQGGGVGRELGPRATAGAGTAQLDSNQPDSGCGCSMPGQRRPNFAAWLLLSVGLGSAVWRRRR